MSRLRFDPNISVGTLLTLVTLLLGGVGLWHKLEVKFAVMNEQIQQIKEQIHSTNQILLRHDDDIRSLEKQAATNNAKYRSN